MDNMENVQKLVKLLFKKYMETSEAFEYGYDELDVLRACICKLEFEKTHPNEYFNESKHLQSFYDSKKILDALLTYDYIGSLVRIGGNSGGSCFDTDSSYESEGRVQFDQQYLDLVLETIAPDLTYLTYRKIEKSIILTLEHTKYEYYGNNSVYSIQLIPIKPLIEMLHEKKCLISSDMVDNALLSLESNSDKKKMKP